MGGQRVVLFQVAERGLRAALRMRRHRRSLAARIDAVFGSLARVTHRSPIPGVSLPLLGPCPLGIATELPGTGVALAHGSGSSSPLAAASEHRPRLARARADRRDDLAERREAVAADERVAVRERGHHAAGPHRERARADARD